jgi:Ca2+-binding EF-hand superfamily protein
MAKFLLGGAALAAVAGLVAIAPAGGQPVQPPMVKPTPAVPLHTRAQVAAHVTTMFQRLDTNRDGFITRAETQAAMGNPANRQTGRPGANRSPEQRVAKRAKAFDRLDANGDGMISRDEFARAPAIRQQQRLAENGGQIRHPGHPGVFGKRPMGGMGLGVPMAGLRGRMFEMADVNRDGRVSLQEATAAAYRHFDMIDANRDGQVTREERLQARQPMRVQRRRPG